MLDADAFTHLATLLGVATPAQLVVLERLGRRLPLTPVATEVLAYGAVYSWRRSELDGAASSVRALERLLGATDPAVAASLARTSGILLWSVLADGLLASPAFRLMFTASELARARAFHALALAVLTDDWASDPSAVDAFFEALPDGT